MIVDKVNKWLFYTFTRHVGTLNQCFMSANSGPSSGCKRWLILLGGIAMVVFELGTRWAPNVWDTKVSSKM
jgi:hypothetical protein